MLLLSVALFAIIAKCSHEHPKLVLEILFDGFGEEKLRAYGGENMEKLPGLKMLIDRGVRFMDNSLSNYASSTSPGHVSTYTGSNPCDHGVIANYYRDENDEWAYSMYGGQYNETGGVLVTQDKGKWKCGTAPSRIIGTTTADMHKRQFPESKVFAVSVKDRSAIAGAGREGIAYWMNDGRTILGINAKMISTQYYLEEYPQWVLDFQAAHPDDEFLDALWEAEYDMEEYRNKDNPRVDIFEGGYPRVDEDFIFPKTYSNIHPKFKIFDETLATLAGNVKQGPAGNVMLTQFVKALIENEGIGQGNVPDYLTVSYGNPDYIEHFFGPRSVEAEDIIYKVDKELKELLEFIDDLIRLHNILIVFTADHGMTDIVEFSQNEGYNYAERVDFLGHFGPSILEELNAKVLADFGIEILVPMADHAFGTNIYFNGALGLTEEQIVELEVYVANFLTTKSCISKAYAASDIRRGLVSDQVVLNSFHSKRSGNVMVIEEAGANMMQDVYKKVGLRAAHGSRYTPDMNVPMIWAGPGVPKGKVVYRKTTNLDIATTLAAKVGTGVPTNARGNVLEEVFED